MKNFIALAVLTAITSTAATAQAKTICTINTGANMQFGNTAFNGEFTGPQTLILTKEGAATIDLSELKSPRHWKEIDGKTLIFIGDQAGGLFGISVAHVDLSQKQNALPMDAMALGDRRSLTLISPSRGVSVGCRELN